MALQKKVKKQRKPQKWDDPIDKEEPTQDDIEKEIESLARIDDDDYYPEDES
jgi:hypothetical protein